MCVFHNASKETGLCVYMFERVYIYVTVNLRNQSFHVMTDMFKHYAKCLFHSGISRND